MEAELKASHDHMESMKAMRDPLDQQRQVSNTPELKDYVFMCRAEHLGSWVVDEEIARTLETQRDEARAEAKRERDRARQEQDRSHQAEGRAFHANIALVEARAEVEKLRKRVEELEAHPAFVVDLETGKFTPMLPLTSPEIFEAHGLEWYRRNASKSIPEEAKHLKQVLLFAYQDNRSSCRIPLSINTPHWESAVGWRPADAPEKLERK